MCGIVGIYHLNQTTEPDRDILNRMNESQFHRGPDEGGLHCEPGVGLGHRRLSIIDLSSGQQPLYNEDDSVVVVYNGEIYNFKSLAEELQQLGHRFRTHCDTEVIVHAWEEWGEDCVQRFRGMFAFAIWDRNRKTLFLARDRLGIKPLYYALLPGGKLIFSSEMKALLIHPELKREIEPTAVEEYFSFGYVPEPKTILKNAWKLSPGFTLTLKPGMTALPEPVQYWDLPFTPLSPMTEQEASDELVRRLAEAVDIRLVAEVPLGAFLSGGVDSSAVVALMAELNSDPVKTCSISFGDPKFNESEFAQMVADRYHTDHEVRQVDPGDFDLVDKLASLYDEPYADSSAMPTYRVCQLAREKVIVALSGDGGDENLAGYRRYYWHMNEQGIRSALPLSLRRPLFGTLGRLYPKLDWAPRILRAKSTFQSLGRDDLEAYHHTVSVVYDDLRSNLFSRSFRSELQDYNAVEVFRRHAANAPTDDPLSLVQYLDFKTYLPGDILTKVDRASMAHSLEVRVPLLDHKVVEWISGLPPEIKLKGTEGKYLFKKSLESKLPNDILYRRKMGFAVPIGSWFKGPLKQKLRDAVLGPELLDTGLFDADYLRKLVDQHQSGRREHSPTLWSLLMYASFQKQVMNA